MRYDNYNHFVEQARDELTADTEKAKVWAMLAQAEAIKLCEPEDRIEIYGAITVDS